ncbi:lipocalin family protein [Zoogloea sp.]|uniref:lipocalin family protein n=1 Tax=Zoogloea sp. TaxID=49181 RepID=UPI0026060585|nr:lipocalin family protein [uncultured Zoogloea sp.]
MRALRKALFPIFLCLGAPHALADVPPTPQPLASVDALDVQRYMGKWYEISHYPNWFQKKCQGASRAEYALKDNGEVQVVNRCRLENGETNVASAVGRQVGGPNSARLKVSFAPAWLSFIPAVWGDYWVVDIDPDYSLVAVSEPKREYLWVLSRTPQVDADRYTALLARLEGQGFDVSKLIATKQMD